jgi:hypothetical protein
MHELINELTARKTRNDSIREPEPRTEVGFRGITGLSQTNQVIRNLGPTLSVSQGLVNLTHSPDKQAALRWGHKFGQTPARELLGWKGCCFGVSGLSGRGLKSSTFGYAQNALADAG